MTLVDVTVFQQLVRHLGLQALNRQLLIGLEEDFRRWPEFRLSSRHATHYPHGVIELMPCADEALYAFKYVNGHPGNPSSGKLSVAAMGVLAEVESGYPLLVSEMTFLTALRTAATAALGAKYLARADASCLAIIGTGAQAEFQASALIDVLPIEAIRYVDVDARAMEKFASNMASYGVNPVACSTIAEAVGSADLIVTATAAKRQVELFQLDQLKPGVHIHAIGGDCPGKTELPRALLGHCKIVVEYAEQSIEEGEIQNVSHAPIYAELWEIVAGHKAGRADDREITLFDAVGFALEDYSVLRVIYRLVNELNLGQEVELIPELDDPKDLFGMLLPPNAADMSLLIRR